MDFEAGQLEPVTLGRAKSSKIQRPPIRWVREIVSLLEFSLYKRSGLAFPKYLKILLILCRFPAVSGVKLPLVGLYSSSFCR
jgi:hypothetical protein